MRTRRQGEGDREKQNRRESTKTIGLGLLLAVIGLGLAGGAIGYRWHLSAKAERLRAEGRPVTATVSDFYSGSGRGSGADWVEVRYSVDGRSYRGRVKCGGFTGCVNEPGPEVTVRVDPDDPGEFVMPDGNTTGSLFFFNSIALIPGGLVLAGVGGAMITAVVYFDRRRKRRLRAEEPARPTSQAPENRTADKRQRKRKRKGQRR